MKSLALACTAALLLLPGCAPFFERVQSVGGSVGTTHNEESGDSGVNIGGTIVFKGAKPGGLAK